MIYMSTITVSLDGYKECCLFHYGINQEEIVHHQDNLYYQKINENFIEIYSLPSSNLSISNQQMLVLLVTLYHLFIYPFTSSIQDIFHEIYLILYIVQSVY